MTVDSAECMRIGWPKCHGETMTIDSPEERRRRERMKIHLSVGMPYRKGTFCGIYPRTKMSKKPEQVTCVRCLKNFAAWMKRQTEG